MGKLMNALIVILMIEFGLYLFGGTTYGNTTLFSMMFNPSTILTAPFYRLIVGALFIFSATTIIVGSFAQINIYAMYAGVVAAFVTFASVIVHLNTFLVGALETSLSAPIIYIMQAVIIVPLMFYYIIACIEWVRSNQ